MYDRFQRQADLVPGDKLDGLTATVIGVGAIGRHVALQLAAIGVRSMQLIDFDRVEESNVTTQGYFIEDVGRPKVDAMWKVLQKIDPLMTLTLIKDRYRSRLETGQAVFCCVDSISTRAAIWRSQSDRCRFWADGRMLGETIRILVAASPEGRRYYPTTLFAQSEAHAGRCTAHGTIYTANVASGLMVHQFTRWLRGLQTHPDTTIDLLAGDFVAI